MRARSTNLALLGLLVLAVATGALAFAIGTSSGRWVVLVHGAAGIAVVVLTPWKQTIVRRGLDRPSRKGRAAALSLTVTVVISLVAGFAHSAGLVALPAGITTMQVHVGAALAAIVPALWHLATRWVRPRRTDVSRRTLMRGGAIGLVALGGWVTAEAAYRVLGLAGGERRLTGSHERGTDRPAAMPVTQWMFDDVPVIDGATWRLDVRLPGGATRAFDLAALRQMPARSHRGLLDCTGGWFATQDWTGVPMSALAGTAGLPRVAGSVSGAGRILVRSVTGYWRAFPIRDADELLLAYDVASEPLSRGHGFPLRVVAPGRRGFWWVKWVDEIVIDDVPWWRQPPFPLQ